MACDFIYYAFVLCSRELCMVGDEDEKIFSEKILDRN